MSACRDERPFDHPDAYEVLPLDLLKDAAGLRAAGHDWMEVGATLGRNHYHLRLVCRRDPRFADELEAARQEVLRETEAEMLRKLRDHMRSEDERVSAGAAERLAKYVAAQRNCDARLAAEEVKKDAKIEAERIRAGSVNQEGEAEAREDAGPREPSRDDRACPAAATPRAVSCPAEDLQNVRLPELPADSEERDVDLDADVVVGSEEEHHPPTPSPQRGGGERSRGLSVSAAAPDVSSPPPR
jgi:hypothetical protein